MSLAPMEGEEGRWPVEVFLNWILPEHFYAQGYRYSLKLDYDTLTIGEFPTSAFERQPFSLAAKQVDIRRGFPEDAVVKAKAELGQDVSFTEYYNVGVVVFDNSRAAEVEFFDWFASLYRLLSEACRDVQGLPPMEQLCFAALAKNLEA